MRRRAQYQFRRVETSQCRLIAQLDQRQINQWRQGSIWWVEALMFQAGSSAVVVLETHYWDRSLVYPPLLVRGRGENSPSDAELTGHRAGLWLIGSDTLLSLLMFHDRPKFRVQASACLL